LAHYRLALNTPARNTQPRYNVCPTTNIDTVIERDGRREIGMIVWGIISAMHWASIG
jgi:putative SOS response-associated peptidase YedK